MLSISFAPRSMQALNYLPTQNYVMDKASMVQRKKSLPCAVHYAIIFASTVRDPPPFPSRTYSSILLLWWNPARPPRPRFFSVEGGGKQVATGCERVLPRFDRPSVNVLLSKTLQNLTERVIFP